MWIPQRSRGCRSPLCRSFAWSPPLPAVPLLAAWDQTLTGSLPITEPQFSPRKVEL